MKAGLPEDRLHTIPNGALPVPVVSRAEARATLGLPEDGPVIGWVGRMSAEKGPDLMVDAMERVTHPDAFAVMIGDGPDREGLARRIGSSPHRPRVRLSARRPDAARLLKAFDVLAISSRTEGLPIVLLEAIQAGIPVVGFAVGGLPEYLDPDTGWLVAPGNCAAFAEALDSALRHPEEREAKALAAQRLVAERLSLSGWIEAVERVYDRARSAQNGGVD
jgi:glycosyltransferase involved in cell wall biosynthesis